MAEASSAAALSDTQRSALLLRTWEAISAERELPGVLASLADVLVPFVPFDSIGIIDFSGDPSASDASGKHRLFALHIVGVPQVEGETGQQFAKRLLPQAQP